MNNDYCGIVFIGGGSSHAYGATKEEAATKAAKRCKSDWKSLFEFKKQQEFKVRVYDMKDHEGWYADPCGVMDDKTDEVIPMLEVIAVTV